MESVSGVGVVDKSVWLLEALAERGALSLAELVEATDIARPTAHRLLVALEAHGIVGRDDRGRFELGARVAAWGSRARRSQPVVQHAAPVLRALREATGESAQLYVRDGDRRVCVAIAERPSGLRDTVPLGARLPLTAGSGAKVLLAWGDAERPEGIAEATLAAVRRRGWAESVAEREPGVASVSAPVRDGSGAVVAAVSVSGPVDRLGRKPGARFSRDVLAAAGTLEHLISP
ncbi:MAG TPA: IclR family transcriptional regulator [Acidimicrobiia bacterium]|jgi:DNA-binding IclR family transcriptional regulator